MLYDLLGDPLDAVLAHCTVQWLVALLRCSRPLQQQVEPFVRQAEEESERLLCEYLGSTREELAGTDTVAWPAGLPEPQHRHLRAWLLPGYPLAHVTKLRIPNRQSPVTFRLPGATKLNLSGYYLGDPVVTVLAAPIATNATLSDLNLGCNKIGDEGGIAIGKALSVNATLTTLYLGSNDIGDEGGVAIAKALSVNATLTTLFLWANKIGDKGGIAIAKALKVNATLTNLNVAWNNISGEAARQLAAAALVSKSLEVLSEAPIKELRADTLTELDLKYKGLGPTEGIVLAELIKVTASLKSLDLSYNKNIGDEGWIAIAKSLEVNAILTTLSLRNNALGQEGEDALCRAAMAKPTLKLFR